MYLESFFNVDDGSFSKSVLLEIYGLSNGEIQLQKLPVKLNPNSLKNIFVYGGYEFNILKIDENKYKLMIYKPELSLTPKVSTSKTLLPSDSLFKFGCELETCLWLHCIKPLTEEIKLKYEKLKETKDKDTWAELIIIYIKEVVIKNASVKFKKLFPKICVAVEPKSGLVNYIVNTDNGEVNKDKVLNFNHYITFTQDSSLICGDSKKRTSTSLNITLEDTIHCEIITPTTTNIGDLEILYKIIIDPLCLSYNPSTSFHVNVSFIKPIYFSFGLCDELIKNYKDFEERNYRLKNNQENTIYAPKIFKNMIYNIVDDMGSVLYYGDMIPYYNEKELFIDKGYYRSYIDFDEKYSSLYCKSNRLIEFRLFSSDNEVKNLMGYLKDSISLLNKSYENYQNNFNKGFEKFQDINLETGIDFSPLKYYEGPLYYKEPGYTKYKYIESLTDKNLPMALTRLFSKRRQIFINSEPVGKKFILNTAKGNVVYLYTILKISRGKFRIKFEEETALKSITYDF